MSRGSFPTGKRWMARKKAEIVKATRDREWVREQLNPHLDDFIGALVADMNDRECTGHRTAMTIVPDLMGWSGLSERLIEAFLARIGATSEDELARGFERGKMAGEADLPAVDRRGIDYFRRRMQAEPGFRRQLLWELFGVREVESESTASRASLGVSGSLEGKNGSDHA